MFTSVKKRKVFNRIGIFFQLKNTDLGSVTNTGVEGTLFTCLGQMDPPPSIAIISPIKRAFKTSRWQRHLPYQLTVLKHIRPRPHACSGVTDTVGHFTFTLYDSQVVGGHEIVSCLLSHWGWSSRALRCTTQRWQVRLTWFSRGRLICLADCNANRHVSAGTRVWQFWVFLVISWGNRCAMKPQVFCRERKKKSKTPTLVLELLSADPNNQLLAIQLFQSSNLSQHFQADTANL